MRLFRPLATLALFVLVAAVAGSPEAVAADENDSRGSVPLAAPIDRDTLSSGIVGTWRAEALARGYDPQAWETDMRRALLSKNEGQLLAVKSAASWSAVIQLVGGTAREVDPLVFGDEASDLVYFPVAPCRILDTRIGTGTFAGPLAAGPAAIYPVFHNQGLVAQGGNAAGCGVPTDPAAIALTVVAVSPSAAGDLRLYRYLDPLPGASAINYAPVPGLNVANTTIVPTCQICGNDFNIKVDAGATHVVADVVGYFWKPTIANKSGFVWAAAHISGAAVTVSRGFTNVGSSLTVSQPTNPGRWIVDVGGDVSSRFYSVIPGEATSGVPNPGYCSATPASGLPNGIYVKCWDSAGNPANMNFYVAVY